MPRLVFISGPLRGTDAQILQNIIEAKAIAKRLWRAGVPNICPHLNSGCFIGEVDEEIVMAGYLDMLVLCDAIVTTNGWRQSKGASEEVRCALEFNIPVYESVEEYLEKTK